MKALNFIVALVVAAAFIGTSQTASAWWGHAGIWGAPVWGPSFAYPYSYGYYGYGYGWADPCCAPVVDACCAPAVAAPAPAECATCAPVCTTCGPIASYGYYGPSYVLGWRPGPIRRLLFGRYRWYATGYWGGYYYTPDCCAPAYDTIQEAPVQNVTPAPEAPAAAPSPAPAETPAAAGSISVLSNNVYHQTAYTQKEATAENSGIVTIYVPQDAVVYVNDAQTRATGNSRSFVSFGLQSGNEYDYVIRAEVTRNGQTYTETKVVTLKAGDQTAVSFAFPAISNPVDQVVAM